MHRGHRRDAWYHTAAIWAILANANRDPKQRSKPFLESDIHPDGEAAYTKPKLSTDISSFKRAFTGKAE